MNEMKMTRSSVVLLFMVALIGCTAKKKTEENATRARTVQVPKFNADSAYSFVERQVKFGPRVPGTKSHEKAGDYFVEKLRKYGAEASVQEFDALTWDNQRIHLKNIIASYNPRMEKRILLAAHWDTRPYADKDKEKKDAPFDGANDGASGVGVLLEIARAINENKKPEVGVDFILFDGEDWGEKEDEDSKQVLPEGYEKWWCLGSQYWSQHKHQKNYSAYYGILLDMVGARHSQFFREGASLELAPSVVEKIWNTGTKLGYTDYFVKTNVSAITDDHVFVSLKGKIPMADIVHYQAGVGFFGDYHHTRKDNLSLISKETLSAVGTTVLNVVYYEEP
ncbi:MAG TPA: M28 family peptidase [Cyclobacteriaceae bacterium]|nr:M28 family peptidase [Cyclobacteriaceae bacterium]